MDLLHSLSFASSLLNAAEDWMSGVTVLIMQPVNCATSGWRNTTGVTSDNALQMNNWLLFVCAAQNPGFPESSPGGRQAGEHDTGDPRRDPWQKALADILRFPRYEWLPHGLFFYPIRPCFPPPDCWLLTHIEFSTREKLHHYVLKVSNSLPNPQNNPQHEVS